MEKCINNIRFGQLFDNQNINYNEFKSNNNWHLSNIKKINILIGSNNSRKSRFLRNMFLSDISTFEISDQKFEDLISNIKNIINALANNYFPEKNTNSIIENCNDILKKKIGLISYRSLNNEISEVITSEISRFTRIRVTNPMVLKFVCEHINHDEINKYREDHLLPQTHIYIPILRGLRPLTDSNIDTDYYLKRTKKDYFPGSNINFENNILSSSSEKSANIFTGFSMYNDLKNSLLGSKEQREKVSNYEIYLSKTFFENQEVSLIPRADDDVVYILIGNEERPIFNLGDGIQELIIITFPIFMSIYPTCFYIEEPEKHLHPGMQRALVDAFNKFPEHKFFITTHSNHLIDISQEKDSISVFRVTKNDEYSSNVSNLSEYSNLLTEIGVRASSVLLANCSIWVEGITDRLYLKTYLNKFISDLENSDNEQENKRAEKLRQFKENLHYIFTEYQGSNITHWDFSEKFDSETSKTPARKMNNKILLIADKDIETKGNRINILKDTLCDSFILLEWKEIENYLPFDIIIKTSEKRWDTFHNRSEYEFKIENLKNNADNFFQNDKDGIGRIIERYVHKIDKTKDKRKLFSEASGTIKDKVKFCQTAIDIMRNEENWELTPELYNLCDRIWSHIECNN